MVHIIADVSRLWIVQHTILRYIELHFDIHTIWSSLLGSTMPLEVIADTASQQEYKRLSGKVPSHDKNGGTSRKRYSNPDKQFIGTLLFHIRSDMTDLPRHHSHS